jgi:hypothetical protein
MGLAGMARVLGWPGSGGVVRAGSDDPSAAPPDAPSSKQADGGASSVAGPESPILELDAEGVYWGPAVKEKLSRELLDDAMDDVVALRTSDGRLYPVLPTESGLFFYRDERVRARPMRVRGRWHAGLSMFEVIDRYSLLDGKPNEIYYWCEICAIQMYHLKDCDCCQGPIELREHPVGEKYRLKSESR